MISDQSFTVLFPGILQESVLDNDLLLIVNMLAHNLFSRFLISAEYGLGYLVMLGDQLVMIAENLDIFKSVSVNLLSKIHSH